MKRICGSGRERERERKRGEGKWGVTFANSKPYTRLSMKTCMTHLFIHESVFREVVRGEVRGEIDLHQPDSKIIINHKIKPHKLKEMPTSLRMR